MGPFGIQEIVIVLAIAVLIFGPRQLPKLGKALGDTVREVRGGGAFGEFERGLSPDATREWAAALARQIDDEALRRFLPEGVRRWS